MQGNLINYCDGEWKCELTDEQIEKEIPDDYRNQKEKLKKIADEIIKNYDKVNQNRYEPISDVEKIGKWVSKNIKYDDDDNDMRLD